MPDLVEPLLETKRTYRVTSSYCNGTDHFVENESLRLAARHYARRLISAITRSNVALPDQPPVHISMLTLACMDKETAEMHHHTNSGYFVCECASE